MSSERYDDLATGQDAKEQRQRQNKRLIENAKEVRDRNLLRIKRLRGNEASWRNHQTSTTLYKVKLDITILKHPRRPVSVMFWQQRPTTSSS